MPVVGYQAALADLGLGGAGVTIAICDSGIDTANNTILQQDLRGRMTFYLDTTGGAKVTDANGHGTHARRFWRSSASRDLGAA